MRRFGFRVFLLAAAVPVLLRASVYVSPSGDDANDGAGGRPVRTLRRAQELVREQIPGMSSDLRVLLAGGVYRLAAPLVFDERDSGRGGHQVIWAAVPGEFPVISGGVRVTGWREIDPARQLWAAPAPAGLDDTRQLYIDGVRADRTRGRLPVGLRETATGYEADSDAMASWRNPSDLEFVYTGGDALWSESSVALGAWTEPRIPVAAIHGRTIVMAEPAWDNSTRRVMYPDPRFHGRTANLVGPATVGRRPEYVENAYELLGTPGQWYFDRRSRTIYYVPRTGEDLTKADVEAAALPALVIGAGTPAHPVHDLTFEGLQFSYATWLYPSTSEGFSEIQANYMVTGPDGYRKQGLNQFYPGGTEPFGNWTLIPGNVSVANAHDVRFIRDAFVHLGAAGLQLGDGAQNDAVVGCAFTDISGNGLELGGVDRPEAPPDEVTRDNRIENNRIWNVAAEYHGGIGILVGYAQRTLVAHNQIDHLPYAAISMGWGGWPDKVRRPGVANNSQDNVVAHNLIFDHMMLLADGGGIYTQGLTGPDLANGEKVVGNIVHDQFDSGHAIYSDNGSCYLTIEGNVMFRTNHDNWGGRHRFYYDGADGRTDDPIVVEGNFWQQGDRDTTARGVVEADNRLITAMDQVPDVIRADAGLEPEYRSLRAATFGAPAAPKPPDRVAAWAGDRYALVAWNPPRFEGAAAIRSYTVTASTGESMTLTAADFASQGYARVGNLKNGAPCTFTVVASTAAGTSPPSLPSFPVTPAARKISLPGPPYRVSVDASGGMASVHIEGPAEGEAGGAPILGYLIQVEPGGQRVVFSGRKFLVLGFTRHGRGHTTFDVIDGLAVGQTYRFEVSAVNPAGPGRPAPTVSARVAPAD